MKYHTLNIGLRTNQLTDLSVDGAIGAVLAHIPEADLFQVVKGAFEDTLIVRIPYHTPKFPRIFSLSQSLMQDCIAVAYDGQEGTEGCGALIGKQHKKWGRFDPKLFFYFE